MTQLYINTPLAGLSVTDNERFVNEVTHSNAYNNK